MRNRCLFSLIPVIFLFSAAIYAATQNAIIFKINVYKDPQCRGKLAGPAIVIDTAKSCNVYSYVDSKGLTTTGSQNHLRCYQNKIVFDKYAFSGRCLASESFYQGKQIVEKDHSLQVGMCQEAASHDGSVYEKLSGYVYPGNENCSK